MMIQGPVFDLLPRDMQKCIMREFNKIAKQDNNKHMISRAELQERIAKEFKKDVKKGNIQDLSPIMDDYNLLFSLVDEKDDGLDINEFTAMYIVKLVEDYAVKNGEEPFGAGIPSIFKAPKIKDIELGIKLGGENENYLNPDSEPTFDP